MERVHLLLALFLRHLLGRHDRLLGFVRKISAVHVFFISQNQQQSSLQETSVLLRARTELQIYGLFFGTRKQYEGNEVSGIVFLNNLTQRVILRNPFAVEPQDNISCPRSEERRVGEECRSRWSP